MFYETLKGLNHLHSKGFIHRDLKPANILLDLESHVHITDFGLTRKIYQPLRPMTNEVCSNLYRAPELLCGAKSYSIGIDIWSFGCIFAEFYKKKPIFYNRKNENGGDDEDILIEVFKRLGTPTVPILKKYQNGISSSYRNKRSIFKLKEDFDEQLNYNNNPLPSLNQQFQKIPPQGIKMLKKIFDFDPNKRPTCEQLMSEKFFDEIRHDVDRKDNKFGTNVYD